MKLFIKLICLWFTLAFAGQSVMAAEKLPWESSAGSVWVDSSGNCWTSSFSGDVSGCGEAPAPAVVEEAGNFLKDDADNDGVVDSKDSCPFTPEGVAVDAVGCALDEDNDGVPDYLDDCPGTPPNTVVNLDGCPLVLVSLTGILFKTNSAELTDADKRLIDGIIPDIKASTSSQIDVVGHTDNTGAESYNLVLSERRAQAVVDYLVESGVAANRLFAFGEGESEPVASNDTREGRQQNRRVEILAK